MSCSIWPLEFTARASAIGRRAIAKEVVEIEVPYNEAIDPAAVEAFLKRRPDVKIVSLCHHDTPSGTSIRRARSGPLSPSTAAYLIVDAVSSFGGMDIHGPDCHADIFVTGPNKCLGSRPRPHHAVGDAAGLGQDESQSPGAARLDAEHSRLGERLVA